MSIPRENMIVPEKWWIQCGLKNRTTYAEPILDLPGPALRASLWKLRKFRDVDPPGNMIVPGEWWIMCGPFFTFHIFLRLIALLVSVSVLFRNEQHHTKERCEWTQKTKYESFNGSAKITGNSLWNSAWIERSDSSIVLSNMSYNPRRSACTSSLKLPGDLTSGASMITKRDMNQLTDLR